MSERLAETSLSESPFERRWMMCSSIASAAWLRVVCGDDRSPTSSRESTGAMVPGWVGVSHRSTVGGVERCDEIWECDADGGACDEFEALAAARLAVAGTEDHRASGIGGAKDDNNRAQDDSWRS